MSVINGEPIVHLTTAAGVLLGGSVWMIDYASHFGVIELDGGAFIGLGLGLVIGGILGGIIGIVHDVKCKEPLLMTLFIFATSITLSSIVVGILLSGYASTKWDYTAAHQAECRAPESTRPLACQ